MGAPLRFVGTASGVFTSLERLRLSFQELWSLSTKAQRGSAASKAR